MQTREHDKPGYSIDSGAPRGYPLSSEGSPLANRPHIPAKEIRGTTAALNEFTRRILAVPHSIIKAALEAEKKREANAP